MTRKLSALGLAAALLPLAVAGCSSAGPSTPAAAKSTAGQLSTPDFGRGQSSSAGSNASAGSVKELTGTQLQALLVTGSQLPAGFTTDPSQDTNSGGALETAMAKYNMTTMSCAALTAINENSGFGETAAASSEAGNSGAELIEQSVIQFPTAAAAQSFYTAADSKWLSCHTFTSTGGSGTATITAEAAPTGLGQTAFAMRLSGQYNGVNSVFTLIGACEGTDFYLVGVGGAGNSAPVGIDPVALTQQLIADVAAG